MAKRRWTLKQILVQMKKYRNPKDFRSRIRTVNDFRVEAAPGIKAIAYVGRVKGNSVPFHNVRIQFFKIDFSEKKKEGYRAVQVRNKVLYYKIPDLKKNPVKLKSSSLSFRFEYEKQLFDRGALVGNWRRYKRKTPPPTRPARPKNPNPIGHDFVNPDNIPGIDITLHSFLVYLEKRKLVIK